MESEKKKNFVRLASIVLALIAAATLLGAYLGVGSETEMLEFTWWFIVSAAVMRYVIPVFLLKGQP